MSILSDRRSFIALVIVVSLGLAGPVAAAAEDYGSPEGPSAGAMGFDAVVVRPLSLVATVVGTGLFVVSLPFSLLGRNVDQAGHELVAEPAKYTFTRPLGAFQYEHSEAPDAYTDASDAPPR